MLGLQVIEFVIHSCDSLFYSKKCIAKDMAVIL